jgi:hypothetical protein
MALVIIDLLGDDEQEETKPEPKPKRPEPPLRRFEPQPQLQEVIIDKKSKK